MVDLLSLVVLASALGSVIGITGTVAAIKLIQVMCRWLTPSKAGKGLPSRVEPLSVNPTP